ncbi:MAG: hypothetical protein U0791_04355 [Gemmataceae bacterium]
MTPFTSHGGRHEFADRNAVPPVVPRIRGDAAVHRPGAFANFVADLARPDPDRPVLRTRLPLDTDNDLIRINDSLTPGVGEITHLAADLLGGGNPIKNALVEIWQCDANGVCTHSADSGPQKEAGHNPAGRFLTGSSSEYYFRTIEAAWCTRSGPRRTSTTR